jgi:hypothetical protein
MKRHLNLLPWSFRRRMLVRRRLGQWSALGFVAVLVMGSVWLWEARALDRDEQSVEALRRRAAPTLGMQQKNQRGQQRLRSLEGGQSLLAELEPERMSFHLLAAISRGAGQCQGRIQVRHLSLERALQPVKTATAPPAGDKTAAKQPEVMEEVCKVSVRGIGTDNLAVAQFVAALRDSSLFHSVELKSTVGGSDAHEQGRAYHIECTL